MSNDPLFEFYKRARNRLRRHEPQSMLIHAIEALYRVYSGGVEVMRRYQPWNLLLAIKWTLQEVDEISHRRAPATRNDLHVVLRILHEIDENVRMPNEYEHVNLFMRHLAFQQFWLQQNASAEALVRQDRMFSFLPHGHSFSRQFHQLTGVQPKDFMDLAYGLMALLLQQPTPKIVRRENFSKIEPSLAPGALDGFLRHLSKTVPELHSWLSGDEFREMSVADQKILPSPLVDTPLIRTGTTDYIICFPTLLMRSLESVIYRTLRQNDPVNFGGRFGPVFEKYVEQCLSDAGLSFLDEASLQARLPGAGKCVDFLVIEDDSNVLIDAKGVEMSARGRVSQRSDLVLSAIKTSAVKAIEQGMVTSQRMRNLPPSVKSSFGTGETFLLVVTFDNLFLGSSSEFGEIFGGKLVPKLEHEFGTPLPFPLENVFFLTIDELERLLLRVYERSATITGLLRHARAHDANPATRKFTFRQHLESFSAQDKRLPMLEAGLNDLCQRCIVRLLPKH